ncbi:MAG: GNAT family N-acetyltransferase [Burkholderiales bacterium]
MSIPVLGAEAAQGLVRAVAANAGIAVSGRFGPAATVLAEYLAGGAGDLLVLTHAQVAQLAARARVDLASCADLGAAAGTATVLTVALRPGPVPPAARELARHLAGRDGAPARLAAGFHGAAIRRADGRDTAAARELVFAILGEYGLVPEPEATDADLMDLERGFLAGGGMFDVAIGEDGRLEACCGLKVLADGRLELRKMYVRRDARGQGLGQRLLDRAIAWARGSGFARVELETASILKEAIALYRKAGFSPRPGKPDTRRCDQAFVLELD